MNPLPGETAMPAFTLRVLIAIGLLIYVVIPLLLYSSFTSATSLAHDEAYYQAIWCASNEGITEVRLPDQARIDCLTPTYAIEVDFAEKAWKEGVGQALWYGLVTRRKPGVVVIMLEERDCKYLTRLKGIVNWTQPPITVWQTGAFANRCPAGDWLEIDPPAPLPEILPWPPYEPFAPYIPPLNRENWDQ
jgi:hypothetical protein